MKRKSLWGVVPGLYILISLLFFAAYLNSENLLPQPKLIQSWFTPDPAAAEQRRIEKAAKKAARDAEKAAKAAAREAARLAKEEARKKEEDRKQEMNPVSLEAVSRYEAVTKAVIKAAYNRFVAAPDRDPDNFNRRFPAMNAYRLQNGLTDFPMTQMIRTGADFRDQVSLETATSGVGDIIIAERNYRNRLAAALPNLRSRLQKKDPTAFDNSRLLYDVLFNQISGFGKDSAEPLLQNFDNFTEFTPRQIAGYIDICRRLNLNIPPLTLAGDRLIASVSRDGDIYMIGNDDSLYCGQVLVAAGKWKENTRWTDVGKTIVATYWEAYPQTPFEEFYDLFDDRYFPKYQTASTAGKTYRIFTCAENFRLGISETQLTVTFTEPVGQTFFFLLYDLPTLTGYTMYNLNWNRDPYFQNYYTGAFFNQNRALFYLKIMIKVPDEIIYLQP